MKIILLFIIIIYCHSGIYSQENKEGKTHTYQTYAVLNDSLKINESLQSDSSKIDTINIKKGINLAAIPIVAYDSDLGLRYGALFNIFNYGNGKNFPVYNHSIYLELSTTTKGSGTYQIIFDSNTLIPKIRLTSEVAYLPEKLLDFYGYNGYQANYNANYQIKGNKLYQSRVFYKMAREIIRVRHDFQGRISNTYLKWFGGLLFYGVKVDTVNLTKLNQGTPLLEQINASNGGLYGYYLNSNLFAENEKGGGQHSMLRVGFIYDSRDNEPNPAKGIWADAQYIVSPPLLKNTTTFTRLALGYRQYVSIVKNRLILATRVLYQAHVSGKYPYYLAPIMYSIPPDYDHDALGGSKTIRGILRNRVVGLNWLMGNFELRYKFIKGRVWNQNIYLSVTTFYDWGMVTKNYELNAKPQNNLNFTVLSNTPESLHQSIGAGLHLAINENFIISADYGMALNKQDGAMGLYVGVGYLF